MTDPSAPEITPEEAALVAADCARDAALHSLLADALALLALQQPAAVSRLRHAARHARTGAELGAYEPQPGMDWRTFFASRAELLEHACAAAGYPHKGADVLAWPDRPASRTAARDGPAEIVPFVPRYERP